MRLIMNFRALWDTIKTFLFNNNCFDKYLWKTKQIKNKKYKYDDTLMILRKYPYGMGLLSCYLTYLGFLLECDEHGYIPVIDMKSHYYALSHSNKRERNKINAWNYYFNNVSYADVDDKKLYRRVIYSGGYSNVESMVFFRDDEITQDNLNKWIMIDEKYICLRQPLLDKYISATREIIGDKRVLGTMVREGYICIANNQEQNCSVDITKHPRQPSLLELCQQVENKMIEWNCDYVFVVAETTLVIDFFKDYFGKKVLYTSRERRIIHSFNLNEYINAGRSIRMNVVDINKDYLEEVFILSKCTSLFSSKCSGSLVASIWNRNEYENMHIINKGLY